MSAAGEGLTEPLLYFRKAEMQTSPGGSLPYLHPTGGVFIYE